MKRSATQSLLTNGRKMKIGVMSDEECWQMHEASIEVLGERGLMFESEEAKDILKDHGAWEDSEGYMRLPRKLIEDALSSMPSEIIMHGRTPEDDVKISRDQVYASNFGEGISILDLDTGERRDTTKQDSIDIARVVDALDNIHIFNRPVNPSDVPSTVANIHNIETALSYTSKPCQLIAHDKYEAEVMLKMARVVMDGHEDKTRFQMGANHNSISPLRVPAGACEAAIVLAGAGMRSNLGCMPQPGATSPMSIAGSLIVQNSEFLGFSTFIQCINKGAPVMFFVSGGAMEMRKGLSLVGCPETLLINAGAARMSKYYNLPSYIAGG